MPNFENIGKCFIFLKSHYRKALHGSTKISSEFYSSLCFACLFSRFQASQVACIGKESACSAGDPGSIPGLGRSPGEGNGKPLQYSCPENPTDRGSWQTTVHGVARVRRDLATTHHHHLLSTSQHSNSYVFLSSYAKYTSWPKYSVCVHLNKQVLDEAAELSRTIKNNSDSGRLKCQYQILHCQKRPTQKEIVV